MFFKWDNRKMGDVSISRAALLFLLGRFLLCFSFSFGFSHYNNLVIYNYPQFVFKIY